MRKMEGGSRRCPGIRVQPSVTSHILLHLLLLVASTSCAPRALPSESDSLSKDSRNSVGMLVINSRTLAIPTAIFITDDTDSDDVVGYYIPVVMAETTAPVSTRDPSIIVVRGCRGGYETDPSGACRKIFSFPSYPKTRPRVTPTATRTPPRPRVVPQTQRDLVRRFNPTRRRHSWFGRSLGASASAGSSSSSSYSSSGPSATPTGRSLLPFDPTTPSTTSTTEDCDD